MNELQTPENDGALERLIAKFEKGDISFLPKETKTQTAKRQQRVDCISCKLCGSYHHKDVVHLEYVGHAAVTKRLLEADLYWFWEPLAFDDSGLPQFDEHGGLWIKLNIKGVTRLGYGNAAHKSIGTPGDREKEVIGDALRNAAMRFGVALELWHKGEFATAIDVAEKNDAKAAEDEQPEIDNKQSFHEEMIAKATKLANDIRAADSVEKVNNLAVMASAIENITPVYTKRLQEVVNERINQLSEVAQ